MIAPASEIAAYKQRLETKDMGEGTSSKPQTPPATPTSQTQSRGMFSLPWPAHQPAADVPFFDSEMYKTVDLNVKASSESSGLDLPFSDITTLRFFFNLGVQQSRAVLQSQLEEQLRNGALQPHLLQASFPAATLPTSSSFADFCPSTKTGLW